MNILETIIAKKKEEVALQKNLAPVSFLEKLPGCEKPVLPFSEFLLRPDKTGIIAEFKRRSPSKGIINDTSGVATVTAGYVEYGASAVSILTDTSFFGGSLNDLMEVSNLEIPKLRKDFIVDEYQLAESKAYGADIILLIAACLTTRQVQSLAQRAKSFGLNVLLEIHDASELNHICDEVDVVGINNRNLKTFEVDLQHSIELAKKIPSGKIKISESGIDDAAVMRMLKNNGFSGFLIGEKFMKEPDPVEAFRNFKIALEENE
jgi:indole-3-glycerol phosphate synthase